MTKEKNTYIPEAMQGKIGACRNDLLRVCKFH